MSDMGFNFREGAEEAADASGGAQFPKLHFLNMKDKETTILRFLHDFVTDRVDPEDKTSAPRFPHLAHPSQPSSTAWIVVNQHSFVPTKSAPADYKGTSWPKTMGSVCRKDKAFGNAFPDCFICDFMKKADGKPYAATARDWALACVREEVIGDGTPELGGPEMKGKLLGYKDKTREVAVVDKEGKPTGETFVEKDIIIVNMAYKNFFSALEGVGKFFGTILDRDFHITRKGDDQNTDYQIVDLGQQRAKDGSVLDLRNPEHYERYKNDIDLPKLIAERAGNDFYARFFDTRVTTPASNGQATTNEGGAPAEQQVKPEADVSDDKMRAIADRVKSHAAASTEQAATPAAEAAPAADTPPAQEAAPAPAPAAAGAGMQDFG